MVHMNFRVEAQTGDMKVGHSPWDWSWHWSERMGYVSMETLGGVLQLAREGKINEEDRKRRSLWG